VGKEYSRRVDGYKMAAQRIDCGEENTYARHFPYVFNTILLFMSVLNLRNEMA